MDTAVKRKKMNSQSGLNVAGKRFHFIGAGGVGMSGLAKVLLKNKAIVTGSDQTKSNVITNLCQLGANIKIGHNRSNIGPDVEFVVISAAIKDTNQELELAREKGCKIYKYAQMLGLLCNRYETAAVAGTHGKSTTSGWLVYCLKQAGIEPSFIVGADITQLNNSSGVGDGGYFVAEACEYDRSFLSLRPKIACVLNVEQDHLDYYKDEDEIIEAFSQFALGTKNDGVVIANGQDLNTAKVIHSLPKDLRYETFGFDEKCNYSARDVRLIDGLYAFDIYRDARLLGVTKISLPGRHNVLNALAVTAMASNIGLEPKQILQILPDFTGIDRRLMLKGQVGRIVVLDDYAHHPTEIKASLAAIRQRYQPKRILCIFQPHQYSRTRFLLDDFAESFKLADVTIVPEIYFVRDTDAEKKQINSQILVKRIRDKGSEAVFIDSFQEICNYLKNNVISGDLVVTMGAGDIWKVADVYFQWLREHR